jgi:hypothetical protein
LVNGLGVFKLAHVSIMPVRYELLPPFWFWLGQDVAVVVYDNGGLLLLLLQ